VNRTQSFFVGDEFLGESPRGLQHRTNAYPLSIAFFCPSCGDIWARCPVEGSPRSRWRVAFSACERCDRIDILNLPGSLWLPLDTDFQNALPHAALLREFHLALKYLDYLQSEGIQWDSRTGTTQAIHGPLSSLEQPSEFSEG
jgi:hypothetical protein